MNGGNSGQLFVISAPSGAGKTSLVQALIRATPGVEVSVSHTTRAMRAGEVEGVDYYFVDTPVFEKMITDNAFLEHARVFDHFYGTSRAAVADKLRDHDVVLEIDWQGARRIRQNMPDAVSIFILPPSYEELEHRLRQRASDNPEVIARRLAAAVSDMSHYEEYNYLIVNEDFREALSDLQAVLRVARLATPVQKIHHAARLNHLIAS